MCICIAPRREHTSKALRYGMRSQEISHCFTCTVHTPHSSANGMNHTCLCLPSRSWYSFTDPEGMESWVGLGNTTLPVMHITITRCILSADLPGGICPFCFFQMTATSGSALGWHRNSTSDASWTVTSFGPSMILGRSVQTQYCCNQGWLQQGLHWMQLKLDDSHETYSSGWLTINNNYFFKHNLIFLPLTFRSLPQVDEDLW